MAVPAAAFAMPQIATWTTEMLADTLHASCPAVQPPDPNRLKDTIAQRVRDAKITGADILQMIADSTGPGKCFTEHTLFKTLFAGTENDFKEASTAVRGAKQYAELVLKKVMLANTSRVMDKAVTQVFSKETIPDEYRVRDFDSFYPLGEKWMIKHGTQIPHTYNSKIGRKGEGKKAMHGWYVSPCGWIRLAIKRGANAEQFAHWHKAYHGTAMENVKPIADIGLVKPEKSKHGNAGSGGEKVVYCSPSIEYAAHQLYTASDLKEQSNDKATVDKAAEDIQHLVGHVEADGVWVQYVFEVLVNPDGYQVQGNTLAARLWDDKSIEYDTVVSSRNLEWVVRNTDDIIVTGVMLRELTCSPKEFNEQRVAKMKAHVGWDGHAAMRPRDFGGVKPDEKAAWEFNDCPGHKNNGWATVSDKPDDAEWKAYPEDISQRIEDAYQDYQRYVFIGQPPGAPGPYIIDFGNQCEHKDWGWPETLGIPLQCRADSDQKQAWRQRSVRRVKASTHGSSGYSST